MAAVVYLHTAAGGLRQSEDMALWHLSNLLSSLAVAAVPLFFMISGALLLGSEKTDDPAYLLRRRLPRVAVPGLCWSLLVVGGVWLSQGGEAALLKLVNLPGISVITPYWFLYALIPMYLLSPLLKRLTDHMEERHWRYLLGLWVVVTLGLNQLSRFLPDPWYALLRENQTLNVSLLEGYLGYFLLGACPGQLGGDSPGHLGCLPRDRRLRRAVCHLPGRLYHGAFRLALPPVPGCVPGPEKRTGGSPAVRLLLRRVPGPPHGH